VKQISILHLLNTLLCAAKQTALTRCGINRCEQQEFNNENYELRRSVCRHPSCLLRSMQPQAVPIQSIHLSWDTAASNVAHFCVAQKDLNAVIVSASC